MRPKTLDHVAVWTSVRDEIAEYCAAHLGMHVIDRNEKFTLIGSDARHGKLTLFASDAAHGDGPLAYVALRVSSLDGHEPTHEIDGLTIKLVEAPTEVEFDLDHVALRSRDPRRTAQQYVELGFAPAQPRDGIPRVEVGGAYVELHEGDPGGRDGTRLHHIAVLVDSAQEHIDEARTRGFEIDDIVDAPNTYALFVRGPEHVRIEYVEHKPTFSLV